MERKKHNLIGNHSSFKSVSPRSSFGVCRGVKLLLAVHSDSSGGPDLIKQHTAEGSGDTPQISIFFARWFWIRIG